MTRLFVGTVLAGVVTGLYIGLSLHAATSWPMWTMVLLYFLLGIAYCSIAYWVACGEVKNERST
jgi:formate-dependent nitrite reductase membrane component NrfD